MIEMLQKLGNYILEVAFATFSQLIILIGPILLLATAMNYVARKNERLNYQVFGRKIYLYVFGWLGTSVHELGHALFAILFAHKVSEVKLFSAKSGKSLGHVKHSYTKGNPFQTLGNFFIGLGPILLGSLLLLIVTWLLFDLDVFRIAERYKVVFGLDLFKSFDSIKNTLMNIGQGVWQCFEEILTGSQTTWWKLILFFYLFYAIGSSITLSSSDIKGASRGFVYFVILLLLFNLFTFWMGNFTVEFFMQINTYLSGFYFLIILSLCLNIIFIVVLVLLKSFLSLFSR